jgi:hypothetical protein
MKTGSSHGTAIKPRPRCAGNNFRHCPWPPDLNPICVQKTVDRYNKPKFYRNFVEERFPFQQIMDENFSLIIAEPCIRMASKISQNKTTPFFQ